jgi:hypothetical protein
MQVMDSFISPIPRFEGDIPILAIPISSQSPGGEPANDPSAGARAGALETQTGKLNAATNLTP